MRILIFGRGVIATQYAWAFAADGHDVEFFVRPGRASGYGTSIKLVVRDGRRGQRGFETHEIDRSVFREDLPHDHDYDLILLSVTHDKFPEAVDYLAPRLADATLLIFNNLWADPQDAVAPLPRGQLVWGFPGGGGGLAPDGTVRGVMSSFVFLGRMKWSSGADGQLERYAAVRTLFRSTGFRVVENGDFKRWLWIHFLMDAALGAQAIKAGGLQALMDSPAHLKEAVLLLKEMMPVLEARGTKPGLTGGLLRTLPPRLLGSVLQKSVFRSGSLSRAAMDLASDSDHGTVDLAAFPRDVLSEARRLNVRVPRLEAIAERLT
jgi:2-dehydropantoate 2-reductase